MITDDLNKIRAELESLVTLARAASPAIPPTTHQQWRTGEQALIWTPQTPTTRPWNIILFEGKPYRGNVFVQPPCEMHTHDINAMSAQEAREVAMALLAAADAADDELAARRAKQALDASKPNGKAPPPRKMTKINR